MGNPTTTGNLPLQQAVQTFLIGSASTEEKTKVIENALESTEGSAWRKALGEWAAREVPVELLVPEVHRDWRPLVREAIVFVVSKLSAFRLAPKIVEQMRLGPEISPEVRLLRFIAKVPGLQKIGQVLARNRNLHPRLRRALIQLENGISDVSMEQICEIVRNNLLPQMQAYDIKLASRILSEATVSAVVAFTWRNPKTGKRERGVFKVLKPHIASCYAEDMKILAQLARHLARKQHVTGTRLGNLVETLTEIRLLLEREVDFPREQATLAEALSEYRALAGVRIPHLIPLLSTNTITAMSFESGKKVTQVHALPAKLRLDVAERLAKAMLAVPALSRDNDAIFHADPHAGNILYDKRRDDLVILDWALTERLSRKQRKNVAMLVLMMMLRDAQGMSDAIEALCPARTLRDRAHAQKIRQHVERLLNEMPLMRLPGAMEAMRLLDEIALDGVRFSAALLMFRKAAFTLEGVVDDVARRKVRLDSLLASQAKNQWKQAIASLFLLLSPRDWIAIEWSALTFSSRLFARALFHPSIWLPGLSVRSDAA
jgi:ubiquinone biosynthesis protein